MEENNTLQQVYAGDTILARHINDLKDEILRINSILNGVTNNDLTYIVENFKGVETGVDNLHDSLIAENGNIEVKNAANNKKYITTKTASDESAGVVKFAKNIEDENLLAVPVTMLNELLKDYPKMENGIIKIANLPDNMLSDRVFGGIVEAKLDGSSVSFEPDISIDDSNNSIYNFQIVTESNVDIKGILPNVITWDEGTESDIIISSGDWIYSYKDDSSTRRYRIIKNPNEISIVGYNNQLIGKDILGRYNLNTTFNNLKKDIEERQKTEIKNAVGEIRNDINSSSIYYNGVEKRDINMSATGDFTYFYKNGYYYSDQTYDDIPNTTTINIELPESISKDKLKKLSFKIFAGNGYDCEFFFVPTQNYNTVTKVNSAKGDNFEQGLYFRNGYFEHNGYGKCRAEIGWEFSNTDLWPGVIDGCTFGHWSRIMHSGGVYFKNNKYHIELIIGYPQDVSSRKDADKMVEAINATWYIFWEAWT